MLAAHGGVESQSATPKDLAKREDHDDPTSLDDQHLADRGRIVDAAGDQGHREIHLIEIGEVGGHFEEPRGQQVQGEDLSAQQ